MKLYLYILFGVWSVSGQLTRKTFDGYKVFRIQPKTEDQNALLSKLKNEVDSLDFWTETNKAGLPVDVMVAPAEQNAFVDFLKERKIDVKVLMNDVQEKISKENIGSLSRSGRMSWDSYYRLEDIHAWMDSLGAAYPQIVSVISAGRSYEGRDIKGLKISFKSGRRSVFIEGGIHAREWISPATVTYIINELLTSSDPNFRRVAESFDWYIFPSVNPDGYVFTHTWYRLWRKTRTPHSTFCYGADPNRNWDFHWGEEGTSTNTCSETYGGPEAFSESETHSLSKMIESIGSTLDVYLAFHSYSQILLISYGTTGHRSENFDDEYEIGKKAAEALSQKYGTEYQVGNSQEILYATSGSSSDWAKYNFQIPIVYTYELRDTGENGFLLPAEQIIPNCEEVMDSIVTIFEESERMGYFKMGSNNNETSQ